MLKAEIQRMGLVAPSWAIKKSALVRIVTEGAKSQNVTLGDTGPNLRSRPAAIEGQAPSETPPAEAASGSNEGPEERLFRVEDTLKVLSTKLGSLVDAMASIARSSAPGSSTTVCDGRTLAETRDVIRETTASAGGILSSTSPPRDVIAGYPAIPTITAPAIGNPPTTASFWQMRELSTADNNNGGPSGTTRILSTAAKASSREALMGRGVASHSVPRVELVSPQLRSEIIQGKDLNLARLLIADAEEFSQREILISGGLAIPVKPRTDHRLLKNLNLSEFIKAFTIYKNVMVGGFPHRADELALYLNEIVDMATDFGGTTFYQYHKQFSARAAALLLNHNIKVDWSIRDNDMYCKLFAGRRANSCALCSSMAHSTDFCPLNIYSVKSHSPASSNVQKRPQDGGGVTSVRPKKFKTETTSSGQEICNNFNTKGCQRGSGCHYAHVCLSCKSERHNRSECTKEQQASRAPAAATQSSYQNPNRKPGVQVKSDKNKP